MHCPCQYTPVLPDTPAVLRIISRIPELSRKMRRFLEEHNRAVEFKNGALVILIESPVVFFEEHFDAFSEDFNKMETDELRFHFHDPNKEPSLEEMLFANSMQYYLNTIADAGFFDIICHQALTSHFQPIVDARNHEIFAYEALVRGVNPDGSLMFPGALFSKSERNGMTFTLDRLARESALKTAAVKKIRQNLFINFVPTAVYDPHFCLESTVRWARQLEFDPSRIVFEVVETERVNDKKHLLDILSFYREQGFQIALDDVGEGYSSLNMLIDIRPDFIKIDRQLIDGIDQNTLKQSLYTALYKSAADHGIKVLAEGIERKEELEFLQSTGVDYCMATCSASRLQNRYGVYGNRWLILTRAGTLICLPGFQVVMLSRRVMT